MRTRDQKYAFQAHKHVKKIYEESEKDRADAKSYGAMAHKLPILIHTSGLAQALAFVDARAKDKNKMHLQLLNDLAQTIGQTDREQLLTAARESELTEYILLTKQTMNALLWYKRFAQSILNVDVGDIEDEEGEIDAR